MLITAAARAHPIPVARHLPSLLVPIDAATDAG